MLPAPRINRLIAEIDIGHIFAAADRYRYVIGRGAGVTIRVCLRYDNRQGAGREACSYHRPRSCHTRVPPPTGVGADRDAGMPGSPILDAVAVDIVKDVPLDAAQCLVAEVLIGLVVARLQGDVDLVVAIGRAVGIACADVASGVGLTML